ncbi:MAG: ATP-binding protein [Actinomycetaceae bacterium]|nr:ATP-binding protein [Actinomycetaceae bacterium]
MRLYKREKYLSKIRGFYHDTGIIKVITGVRRCGKSSLMRTIIQEIVSSGLDPLNVIYLDLDLRKHRDIKTPDRLEELIDSYPTVPGTKYLFIDEIQNVTGFEELLNGYRTEDEWSIFITGSNSYLLSGELVTKLTGRYLEFDMYTLDFAEYLGMKEMLGKPIDPNRDAEFANYVREGGFPKAIEYDSPEDKQTYLRGVIEEILEKDVTRRVQVRNVSVFKTVRDYLINNFGATVSVTNLLNYFNNVQGIPIKRETLNRYIDILVDAKILYRCQRFDMKSRKSLTREEKYYIADLGFYFALNTDNRINYGPVLENLVYFYARGLGYQVSVGRIGALECDFIMRAGADNYAYVQVAMSITQEGTENREYAPLEQIADGYPKFLLTMDRLLQSRSGIRHENIVDFIAEGRDFL